MAKRRIAESEKSLPISFSLPPDIRAALEKVENKSLVVTTILEENLHRIGDMSVLEADMVRRARIRKVVEEEITWALERIRHRVATTGIGNLDYKGELEDESTEQETDESARN